MLKLFTLEVHFKERTPY